MGKNCDRLLITAEQELLQGLYDNQGRLVLESCSIEGKDYNAAEMPVGVI